MRDAEVSDTSEAAVPTREVTTGGEAVAEQLVRAGVETVFGVPGIQLDYLLDGFAQRTDQLRFVSGRHEQGAAYMADGFARATGKPGVFTVVPGPGILNATAGLSTAYACSSPVVCLSGQISTWAIDQGLGMLHEIPGQERVLESVAKKVHGVRTVEDLPRSVAAALAESQSGRPRPVVVSMPDDLLKAPFSGDLGELADPARPAPDAASVDRAVAALERAQRPVVVAGGGALSAGASTALTRLAHALKAPVIVSQHGKGAISERDAWALTTLAGRRVLPEADLVLLVGTRGVRHDGSPYVAEHIPQVWINADVDDLRTPPGGVAVHSDAQLDLEAIVQQVRSGASTWRTEELDAIRQWCSDQIAEYGELAEWVAALRTGIPDDGIIVGELTQVWYMSRVAYPVYQPRTSISPGYQGTLGFGVGTAVGAQVGRPDVPVFSVSGDGGFAYGMSELLTAATYSIPVTLVVFNDGAYGNVRRIQIDQFDGRTIASTLHNPDYQDLARSFGIAFQRITEPDDLSAALQDAVAADAPLLIEVPVGEFADPSILFREVRPAAGD